MINQIPLVAAISDDVLIPYAAPGSKTENLFREVIASGKRVYTFNSAATQALVAGGALAIEPDHFLASK